MDQVLPADAIAADAIGVRQFETRYGLLGKRALVRFRILDSARSIGGMSDLSVPVTQFAALELDVEQVFIMENEINALAFPDVERAMVIFGGGYGIDVSRRWPG